MHPTSALTADRTDFHAARPAQGPTPSPEAVVRVPVAGSTEEHPAAQDIPAACTRSDLLHLHTAGSSGSAEEARRAVALGSRGG